MKKLLIALVLVIGGLLAFNYATTGELKLVPSFNLSAEERQVKDLEDRFADARKQFAQAHRTAAVGGIDTTADAEAARRTVNSVGKELEQLRRRLTEDGAKRRAAELAGALEEFRRELR